MRHLPFCTHVFRTIFLCLTLIILPDTTRADGRDETVPGVSSAAPSAKSRSCPAEGYNKYVQRERKAKKDYTSARKARQKAEDAYQKSHRDIRSWREALERDKKELKALKSAHSEAKRDLAKLNRDLKAGKSGGVELTGHALYEHERKIQAARNTAQRLDLSQIRLSREVEKTKAQEKAAVKSSRALKTELSKARRLETKAFNTYEKEVLNKKRYPELCR